MRWLIGLMAALLIVLTLGAAPPEAPNVLENGGFESQRAGWTTPDGAAIVAPGRSGGRALRVANQTPGYTFAQQSALLDGSRFRRLTLAAWMRWEGVVRGREQWEGARMHLTFHDAAGKQLGGWPDAGVFSGTSGWRQVSRTFDIPRETTQVVVYLGLQNCIGTVWFDDVRVTAVDAQGEYAQRVTESRTDTRRWLAFNPPPDDFGPSAIDMSGRLDPPAGNRGWARVRRDATPGGPMLEFEDGTPARFWGVNIVAGNCFPDRATARRVATRLARAGCNMVRFHHMDAEWARPNIFDPKYNDTQHLSADSLDRLGDFIAELKRRGIYLYVDLTVHRKLKAGDGARDWREVEAGLKIVGHFNPRLIELQKQFATQLMTYRNPHTGLRLVDDPAVVFQEVINESTLFWSRIDAIPESYKVELRGLFSRWLRDRYSTRAALASAWRADPQPLSAAEDPARGTARLARGAELDRGTSQPPTPRVRDTMLFLHEVQTGYFRDMRDHLRGLGARYLIAGSNHWTGHVAEFATQVPFDFIDRHNYFAHPEGGFGWKGVRFHNHSALLQDSAGPASVISRQAVLGKPFTCSEWQYSWPNEYRLEGVPLIAAHAAFQGWDAALQFDYTGGDWADRIDSNFDTGNKPDLWAQWPAMALMFHRGDLSPTGPPRITATGPRPELDREWVGSSLPAGLETRALIRTRIGPATDGEETRDRVSDSIRNPQLAIHNLERRPGLFLIHSPRTQAIVGFLQRAGRLRVGATELESPTEFGSVIVSSLTDDPISHSTQLLITTVGRAENTGMVYGPTRDTVLNPGRPPILMDPVRGTLRLHRDGGANLRVYRLDGVGRRAGEVTAVREGSSLRIPLDREWLTLWYEVTSVPGD